LGYGLVVFSYFRYASVARAWAWCQKNYW